VTECPRWSASPSILPPMLPLAPIKAIVAMDFDHSRWVGTQF
jgi:hypothetical protein